MIRVLKKYELLKIINNYIYDSWLATNINYFYNFGSILGYSLVFQIITGIFLAMYYIPGINSSFMSIEYIMIEVHYGWMIRYLHSINAALFFLAVYIHMTRGILYGSYIKLKMTWFSGVLIFLLMIITAFLGYSLVFGQMSYWAATVITNLLSTIPFIGQDLVYLIWGSYSVSTITISRFYALHYLLPFIIVGLAIIHLVALHEIGGSNPIGVNKKNINFHPYYSWQDILGILLMMILLLGFLIINPNYLNHSDNYIQAMPLVTPTHIVPEIYLLPFYAILRAIENKTLGVIAMLASILLLMVIPYLHNHIIVSSHWRPIYRYIVYLFIINFLLLIWIGEMHISYPYDIIGKILTAFYFFWLIFLIPVISLIEFIFYICI